MAVEVHWALPSPGTLCRSPTRTEALPSTLLTQLGTIVHKPTVYLRPSPQIKQALH